MLIDEDVWPIETAPKLQNLRRPTIMARTPRGGGRDRKLKGPSPNEIRAEWARTGNIEELWRLLTKTPWHDINQEDVLGLLFQALEVRSQADPEQFAGEVMGRMILFVSRLVMRSHLHLNTCVEQNARFVRSMSKSPGDWPKIVSEVLLPRTLELHEHLASLLLAEASINRQWTLVRKNRSKEDHAKAIKPGNGVSGESAPDASDVPTAINTNGLASNRIVAHLNGSGLGTNGVDHGELPPCPGL